MNKVQMLIQKRIQDNGTNFALEKLSADVFNALEQDLSHTLNAPITPTKEMMDVGDELIDKYCQWTRAQDVYTAMIYAGQKKD